MNKKMNKKAVELAINTVIMLIIGIVLFGLGMSLFSKISGSGNDQIDSMRVEVIDSLAGLECNSQEWLCVPSTKVNQGDSRTVSVYVTNLADTEQDIGIILDTSLEIAESINSYSLTKTGCGTIIITPYPGSIPIARGEVAKIPMFIDTGAVSKSCSFTTTISVTSLSSTGSPLIGDGEKAPVIIQVE